MLKPGIHRVKNNASNSELQAAIEAVIPMATKQMQSRSNQFKGATEKETCKKIFDYLKALNYKADGNEQQVRLPSGLVRTQTGDCKSYAVFTSAVLSNLKIPHYLVYTSYNPADKTPTHVYVVTKNNCIVDAVWGKFNSEKKPTHKIKKPMNISYIAGTGSRMGATSCSSNNAGIMATEGALEWANRNGISLTTAQKASIAAQKVLVAAMIGRAVVRNIIQKNAGGLATSLQNSRIAAGSQKPGQADWDRIRKIELAWLFKGGNPNELYESISEGATKTPTGYKFYEVLQKNAAGQDVAIGEKIAAAISALFGKKYNPATGAITGTGIMGEPTTTTTAVVSSAPWWGTMIKEITIALGTVALQRGGNNLRPTGAETTPTPTDTTTSTGAGTRSFLTPVLLIGGAAAAYFLLTSKNK